MLESTEEKPSPSSSDFLHEYLQKTDLSTTASLNQFIKDHHISRDENETDEAFTKRVKKINYLNLAQQLIRNSSQNPNTRQINKSELKSPNHVRIFYLSKIISACFFLFLRIYYQKLWLHLNE
jgi:hypothetical protein